MHDKRLMKDAAAEIRDLRKINGRLAEYHRHTERMLGLFEGAAPNREPQGYSEDVAWALEQRIAGLEAEEINAATKAPEAERA